MLRRTIWLLPDTCHAALSQSRISLGNRVLAGWKDGRNFASEEIAMKPYPARKRGLTARLLRPIAEVRDGEAAGVLLLALNLFLVLAAYYMLKTVRESLILAQGGAA